MFHSSVLTGNADEFRRFLLPKQIRNAVDQVVTLMFLSLPQERQNPVEARQAAQGIFDEAATFWRSLNKSNPNALAISRGLKIEGDDEEMPSFDLARFAARNAMMTCWMALPDGRRSDDEVVRVARLMLSRALASMQEDATLFEGGGTEPRAG